VGILLSALCATFSAGVFFAKRGIIVKHGIRSIVMKFGGSSVEDAPPSIVCLVSCDQTVDAVPLWWSRRCGVLLTHFSPLSSSRPETTPPKRTTTLNPTPPLSSVAHQLLGSDSFIEYSRTLVKSRNDISVVLQAFSGKANSTPYYRMS